MHRRLYLDDDQGRWRPALESEIRTCDEVLRHMGGGGVADPIASSLLEQAGFESRGVRWDPARRLLTYGGREARMLSPPRAALPPR